MSVVLNAGLTPEQLGKTLTEFHSFTMSFPPQLKGEAIASSEEIRKAHNAFSRKDAFLAEGRFHMPTGTSKHINAAGTCYCFIIICMESL